MAEINVEVVNNSGQTVGLRLEEGGEMHEYLKTLVRREDLQSVTATGSRSEEESQDGPPSKTAPKAAWVDYAVEAHSADRAEAEGLTKADLIELYGG
jgi:predicted DNA-binding protein with PD1-like motif